MGVRVRIEFTGRRGRKIKAVALLNGGFESLRPAVVIPAKAAIRVLTSSLSEARPTKFEVAGGEASFLRAGELVAARVVTRGRKGPSVRCIVYISAADREILVSDTAIDALGIELRSVGRGLWRFAGERGERPSEPEQLW